MTEPQDKPAPKRGRPPRGSEGGRRREILAAAEDLFLIQGFGAVSMDAIAKHAGVSKKTIYCQFETKEDLFQAIMRSHMDALPLPALPPDAADVAAFESAIAVYLEQLANAIIGPVAVGLFRLSISEAVRFPGIAESFYREGALRHITHLEGWLSRQQALGLIELCDARATANMLTSFTILEPLRANALGVRELPSPEDIGKRAQMIAKIFARGCVKPEKR